MNDIEEKTERAPNDNESRQRFRFRWELEGLINAHSQENGSDTPDFILAQYLIECLNAFDKATRRRTKWYS